MAKDSVARFLMLSSYYTVSEGDNYTYTIPHAAVPLHYLCARTEWPPFVLGEENLVLQASSDPGG